MADETIKNSDSSFKSPHTNPILPPETWDKIFRDFSSTDFISVINAAPEWNQLLGSRKTVELFNKVFPYLLPYLNAAEILTCRQVTKSWKEGAEQIIQSVWASSDTWFDSHYHKTNYVYSAVEEIGKKYVFGVTQKLELAKFVKALSLRLEETDEIDTGNPFLTRSLEIDTRGGQGGRNQRYLFLGIEITLSYYGNYIWRLKYIPKSMRYVTLLSSYLRHLRHLKILELSCDLFQNWPSVAQIEHFRRITNLPSVPELECLNVTFLREHWLAAFFVDTYGPQLTALAIHGSWLSSTEVEIGSLSLRLLKLKKLRIVDASSGEVSSLSQMRWPLEILQIQLTISTPLEVQRILKNVCTFKDTLICLQLQVDEEYYMNLALETDNEDVDFCDYGSERMQLTAFHERDFIALAKLAFEMLPKLEKIVFWIKKEDDVLVKYVINSQSQINELAE